ncbi:DoxX family protein [Chryseobacterium sp. 'Rf worker isolate 10']|uniref:DoxX family protein n=1 Tax=Chryseobacterium sp. 'Rf worker isolate 10' TaxID=2887348 RepID=UPI003D6E4076
MKKINPQIPVTIGYFFILLFCYAAVSKLLDFENFQLQLAQSPLLSAFAGFISYAVIIVELIISLLLCVPKTRIMGLYASLSLMSGFTIYIFLILNYSDFIPCSCGGILEKLGWTEHLIFNMICVALAAAGIILYEQRKEVRLIRPVLFCNTTIVISCAIIVILFSSSEYIIKKENNFTRRFLLHPVLEDKSLDLALNSYYFAGISNGEIYLGNITAPLLLTTIDTSLKETKAVKINLDTSEYRFRNIQLQVKDSSYYLYDGSVPIIYRGTLGNTIARTISYQDAFFTQLAILDSLHFIIRTQSSKTRQYTLAALDLLQNPKLQLHPSILEKQIDGVFDVDGKLISTPYNSEILYTYTYRNQILAMDKQLNLLRKMHTIDTTTVAKIQTRRLSDGTHKMSSPPLKVNGEMASHRNLLFIHSSLKGRHESSKMWKRASVVDIYRTDQQEYVGSFYINNKGKNVFSHMAIDDQYLYVLIENELKRYWLREPISKYFN